MVGSCPRNALRLGRAVALRRWDAAPLGSFRPATARSSDGTASARWPGPRSLGSPPASASSLTAAATSTATSIAAASNATPAMRRRQRPLATRRVGLPFLGLSPMAIGIRGITTGSKSSGGREDSPSSFGRGHCGSCSATGGSHESSDAGKPVPVPSGSTPKATAAAAATSDPSMVTWVDDYVPEALRPYAHLSRMDKPIGTWLLLWPCYWSAAMAAGVSSGQHPPGLAEVLPDPALLGLFGIGAFVMRGAGCTINDLWDRDLDKEVARTRTRPLAAGLLGPRQALAWLGVQLSAGLGVLLSLQPHTEYCFWWGASALPLVVAYPLAKRCFDYPQLVLGLCFNWGAFVGWAAVHGSVDYSVVLPLYASGVAWTVGYDTLYAHQDKEDDARLGLRSTAITFGRGPGGGSDATTETGSNGNDEAGRRSKRVLHGLAAATYACWLLAGYNGLGPGSAPGSLLPFGAYAAGATGAYSHLVWQVRTADLGDPHNLAERFRSNAAVGGIVFGSVVAGKLALLL